MKEPEKKPSVRWVTVAKSYADQRVDNFLLARLKGLPKSRLYRLLRKGEVRVNKKRVRPSYRLVEGDEIRIPPIRLSESKPTPKPSAELLAALEQRVLFEDDDLLVLNKPSGLAVHGGSGISLGLIEALRQLRPHCKDLELVHRLDRETSGCIVIAKKRSILKVLHKQLEARTVKKIYWALVYGEVKEARRRVELPLHKNTLQSGERMVRVSEEGKPAKTEFRVLERLKNATLLEAKPVTGRTHQIRVHAMAMGNPLAGDEKYGHKRFNKQMKALGLKRLFLHAAKIEFTVVDKKISVACDLEPQLAAVIKELQHGA